MKSFKTLTSTAIMMMSLNNFAASTFSAGTYQLDPMHSKIGFEVPHLVISTVEGKFTSIQGSIELAKDLKLSKAEISIDAKSIDTGVEKRDEHLKSADFFGVKENPLIQFRSTAFTGTPEKFKLVGDLTIKGVTHKVELNAKYLGTVVDGYGNEKVAFQANSKINRKDFGLTWNSMVEAGPVVGDEITIDLRIQAARPKINVSMK